MLIYLSTSFYIETAKEAVEQFQVDDMENCYLCPVLVFSGLKNLSEKEKMPLRLDLLSVCDEIIFLGDLNDEMKQELEFARLVNMEVSFIEE